MRHHGIVVQTVHPGYVHTNMTDGLEDYTRFDPTADAFAAGALKTLGLEYRTAGFWFHKIIVNLCSHLIKHFEGLLND